MTTMELGHIRKHVVKIPAGSKQFDPFLGVKFQPSTPAKGPPGQITTLRLTNTLSHTAAPPACPSTNPPTSSAAGKPCSPKQSPWSRSCSKGSAAEGKVAYIKTEGAFRPERITQIAERFWRRSRVVLPWTWAFMDFCKSRPSPLSMGLDKPVTKCGYCERREPGSLILVGCM
jgi:RecA/RadA recombinase